MPNMIDFEETRDSVCVSHPYKYGHDVLTRRTHYKEFTGLSSSSCKIKLVGKISLILT